MLIGNPIRTIRDPHLQSNCAINTIRLLTSKTDSLIGPRGDKVMKSLSHKSDALKYDKCLNL